QHKIGVGIIGAGIMGTHYARTLREHPNVKIVGIADIIEERAENLAKEVGATSFNDFKKIINNENINAVFVTTPDHLHKEPVILAAEARKHIWIEKPFATSIDEANEMIKEIRKVQKEGVKVTVQFMTRWSPFYTAFYDVINWGYAGEPISVSFSINDRIDVPLSMWGKGNESWVKNTTVADFLMCYQVDLIRWMTGKEVEEVYALSKSRILKFTEDYYKALLQFNNNFDAFFESNWVHAKSEPLLSEHFFNLVCSKATMYYTHPNTSFAVYSTGGGEIFFEEGTPIDVLLEIQEKLKEEGIVSRIVLEPEKEWLYHQHKVKDKNYSLWIPATGVIHKVKHHNCSQVENFIYSIIEDQEPFITADDGYKATKVVCAVKESARKGEKIKIL
ncbi:MAG: Gfo/Idh/MocA family oxidoreductase, partial [Nitrososphaeria archaeon]